MPGAYETLTFEALRQLLKELGLEALKVEPALAAVALYLASRARRAFDEGRSVFGVPWPALRNPSKKRGGASAKPLRDSGILMGSYTAQAESKPGEGELTWGSNVDYASYHQDGTKTIPDRPALGLTAAMKQRIGDIVVDRLEREAKGLT